MRSILLPIFFVILFTTCFAYGQYCLPREPEKVTVKGTLIRKILPGPLGFESIEKGDRPEMYWILKLSSPVCVDEDRDEEFIPDDGKVERMHLVIEKEHYPGYERFISKKVAVTGVLSKTYSAYDNTRVMDVISMTLDKK